MANKYDNLKIKLECKYKTLFENEENNLKEYIIKLETEKKESMRSLNKNKQFKKHLLNHYMGLKNMIRNEIDKSISFIKTNEENTEKKK